MPAVSLFKLLVVKYAIKFMLYIYVSFVYLYFIKNTLITTLLTSIIFVILVLLSVAFLTLLERKKLASIQNRKGPNKVGFWGIMQPVVDGIKLILKETVFPINSLFGVFIL